jgi:poly [ADP-ribose] polymerase
LQTTHAATHRSYELELVDLFELHSEIEKERYTKDIPNKMLLWHGSRLTNFVGILSQGLRIAPP